MRAPAAAAPKCSRCDDRRVSACRNIACSAAARFGGYQESVGVFLRIVEALTEGCASSAWVYGVLGELQWVIALLPERGQNDIWGDAPEAVAAGSLVPRALARRSQDGWRISGRYSFASGCMHAQWVIIAAGCEDTAGNEVPRYLAIPTGRNRDRRRLALAWHAWHWQPWPHAARRLRAGAPSVSLRDVLDGTPPGLLVHPDYPLLRAPRYYLVPFVLPAVAFALARKALSLLPPSLHARGVAPSDILHMQLGEAAAQIETANLIFAARRAESVARLDAGEPIDDASVLRNRRDVTLAFGLLKRGVERLAAINGARTVYDKDPLQSVLLDITAISTHIILNEQAAMVPYGRWMMEHAGSV